MFLCIMSVFPKSRIASKKSLNFLQTPYSKTDRHGSSINGDSWYIQEYPHMYMLRLHWSVFIVFLMKVPESKSRFSKFVAVIKITYQGTGLGTCLKFMVYS